MTDDELRAAYRAEHGYADDVPVHVYALDDGTKYVSAGEWIRLEGGTLDLGIIRRGAPWWRPFTRRRLRRESREMTRALIEAWRDGAS